VAVHLFTLGVLTPLIVAFSREQVRTLLRVVPARRRGDPRPAASACSASPWAWSPRT
jgi:hypothetical protein